MKKEKEQEEKSVLEDYEMLLASEMASEEAVEIEAPELPIDEAAEKEAERIAKLDIHFSDYPKTLSTLTEDPEFEVTDRMEQFMAGVGGYMKGKGSKTEEIDEALSLLFSIGRSCREGRPTIDMLELLLKGMQFDHVIEEKVREAEVKGRNAKIESKLREKPNSDGLPHITSRRSVTTPAKNRGIFSLAEDAR